MGYGLTNMQHKGGGGHKALNAIVLPGALTLALALAAMTAAGAQTQPNVEELLARRRTNCRVLQAREERHLLASWVVFVRDDVTKIIRPSANIGDAEQFPPRRCCHRVDPERASRHVRMPISLTT